MKSVGTNYKMSPIILGYWRIRGYAQPIRLLLQQSGVKWQNKFYPCGGPPDYDKTIWLGEKEKLGFDFPNLPYMIDGNLKLTQSHTIMRYIARRNGLLGTTEEEQIRADLVEHSVCLEAAEFADFNPGLVDMFYSPDFVNMKSNYLKNVLPLKLKRFSTFLGHRPYFAGNNLTFADFFMYEVLDQHKVLEPLALTNYKNLEDFNSRIEELPRIAAYMKSSEFIKYPLNNPMASFGG